MTKKYIAVTSHAVNDGQSRIIMRQMKEITFLINCEWDICENLRHHGDITPFIVLIGYHISLIAFLLSFQVLNFEKKIPTENIQIRKFLSCYLKQQLKVAIFVIKSV